MCLHSLLPIVQKDERQHEVKERVKCIDAMLFNFGFFPSSSLTLPNFIYLFIFFLIMLSVPLSSRAVAALPGFISERERVSFPSTLSQSGRGCSGRAPAAPREHSVCSGPGLRPAMASRQSCSIVASPLMCKAGREPSACFCSEELGR